MIHVLKRRWGNRRAGMHKGRLLNVISGLVAIVKKLSNVSSLRDATPSTGSLTRLPMTDNHRYGTHDRHRHLRGRCWLCRCLSRCLHQPRTWEKQKRDRFLLDWFRYLHWLWHLSPGLPSSKRHPSWGASWPTTAWLMSDDLQLIG